MEHLAAFKKSRLPRVEFAILLLKDFSIRWIIDTRLWQVSGRRSLSLFFFFLKKEINTCPPPKEGRNSYCPIHSCASLLPYKTSETRAQGSTFGWSHDRRATTTAKAWYPIRGVLHASEFPVLIGPTLSLARLASFKTCNIFAAH